jgi:predicted RNase H-like nuclease
MGTFVGVDWGGKRWVTVEEHDGALSFATEPSFQAVCDRHSDADLLFVDIPIGLPDNSDRYPRDCDEAARELVHPTREVSVFDVPARQAVQAATYDSAREQNLEVVEDDIGPQTWGIMERIHEVDVFMRESPPEVTVRESHPEVCFAALSKSESVVSDKSDAEGMERRLSILETVSPSYRNAFEGLKQEINSKAAWKRRIGVGMLDDVIDALALVAAARLCSERGLEVLGGQTDSEGLSMEIVYPDLEIQS